MYVNKKCKQDGSLVQFQMELIMGNLSIFFGLKFAKMPNCDAFILGLV
jgi:hypothetical protein